MFRFDHNNHTLRISIALLVTIIIFRRIINSAVFITHNHRSIAGYCDHNTSYNYCTNKLCSRHNSKAIPIPRVPHLSVSAY